MIGPRLTTDGRLVRLAASGITDRQSSDSRSGFMGDPPSEPMRVVCIRMHVAISIGPGHSQALFVALMSSARGQQLRIQPMALGISL